ncbi:MAG: hypothetical protein Q4G68_00910 [Planctomycetia bacterium]|nr:hypothetical protein [Planctomycetia bacterium]
MRRQSTQPFSLFAFQDIITSVCGIIVLITLLLALELATRILAPEAGETAVTAEAYSAMQEEFAELTAKLEQARDSLSKNELFQEELITATPAELKAKVEAAQEELTSRHAALTEAEARLLTAQGNKETNKKTFDEIALLDTRLAQAKHKKSRLDDAIRSVTEQKEQISAGNGIYFGRSTNVREFPWLIDIAGNRIVVFPLALSSKPLESVDFSGGKIANQFTDWARTRSYQTEYFVMLVRPDGITTYEEIMTNLPSLWRTGVDFIGQTQKIEFLPEETSP